ncbi:MAG TPA: Na+/H+ antiporter subunit A [Acidimicrobiia bacterium]
MLQLLIAHLAAALAAPALVRWLGRRAFLLLAAVPAGAAVWAITATNAVLDGREPTVSISWVPALGLDLVFRVDTLSWLLVLMVGGIGSAVLIYSTRYFSARSSDLGRFAAVFVGFAGAMLGLVTSENLIQLYVFWELTTIFSYLLIGHYSERVTSRRAAMKAILVTTLGGLAMLAGIVLLGHEAGTYELGEILTAPPTGAVTSTAIALILVGAVSKSALIPFHFWLPAAMAAPTPVSAYLHAAAMVKAGVYLVGRLAPGFSTLPVWQAIIGVLALITIVHGGFRALRQSDLKLILAFSTVSQLGMLVLLVGSPFKAGALAGLALLGAHALFKACLFLVVGIVDAATGTRDLNLLSGIGRRMPVTATIGALGVASMIGVAPFAGYVAKEAALEAIIDDQAALAPFGWPILVVFALGSALTIAYGLRFWWGAFATKRNVTASLEVVRPPLLLVAPPMAMALAGIATALLPGLGETLLRPHARTYPLGEPGHLAMWSGFSPAFQVTLAAFAIGIAVFLARHRLSGWRIPWPEQWDGDRVYRNTLRRVDQTAAATTAVVQRGSLPFYLGILFLVVVVGALPGLLTAGVEANLWLGTDVIVIAASIAIVAATVLAVRARRRMKAVILAGITGYSTALVFLVYGAPDLALTQVLVETVTLVVFVLVLRRLPIYFSDRPLVASRWLRLSVAAVFGLLVAGLALLVPQARIHEPDSADLPTTAEEFGGGKNVVNVILVDTRAWDTLGEISVLLAAATGVASLIFLRHRSTERPRPGSFEEISGKLGASEPDPVARLRRPRHDEAPTRRASWLVAGVTLAPHRRSVILEVAVRFLYHTMIVVAVFLLVSGHNAPGGGFVAGLVVGIAITARYLAGGRYELSAAAPLQPAFLLGSGLFLAAGTGLASMIFGGEVLESAIVRWTMPVFGEIKLVTSLIFDIGVFLVVIGLMLDILRSLGAELDHQGDVLDEDGEPVRQALEPAKTIVRRES